MPITSTKNVPSKCLLGKACLPLLGKVCLVRIFPPRQEHVVQYLLFLPPLLRSIGTLLLLAKLSENLAVLMRALIDGQLLDSLGVQLL